MTGANARAFFEVWAASHGLQVVQRGGRLSAQYGTARIELTHVCITPPVYRCHVYCGGKDVWVERVAPAMDGSGNITRHRIDMRVAFKLLENDWRSALRASLDSAYLESLWAYHSLHLF